MLNCTRVRHRSRGECETARLAIVAEVVAQRSAPDWTAHPAGWLNVAALRSKTSLQGVGCCGSREADSDTTSKHDKQGQSTG